MAKRCVFISLLFSFFGTALFADVEVTLLSANLVRNNHVGNEWFWEAKANSKGQDRNDTVHLSVKAVTLSATVVEQDKIPDVGRGSLRVTKSGEYELEVIVRENRGRYSGNTARWVFVFQVVIE